MTDICTGDICRPGGYEITDRAMAYCGFPNNAKLADIGCGLGATVRHIRQNYVINIMGIEKNEETAKIAGSEYAVIGDAACLPFGREEMDGLLFECSLSKMDDPEVVLQQCNRVLKPEGLLIISDLYARGRKANLSGLLGRVETKETLMQELETSGFIVKLFEDYSNALHTMWGQLILNYGKDVLCKNFGTDYDSLRRIKCSYCLIIAQKGESF